MLESHKYEKNGLLNEVNRYKQQNLELELEKQSIVSDLHMKLKDAGNRIAFLEKRDGEHKT